MATCAMGVKSKNHKRDFYCDGHGRRAVGNHVGRSDTYRNNRANDERVVVAKDNIVSSLEAHPKLRAAVLLRILKCTARKEKASKG